MGLLDKIEEKMAKKVHETYSSYKEGSEKRKAKQKEEREVYKQAYQEAFHAKRQDAIRAQARRDAEAAVSKSGGKVSRSGTLGTLGHIGNAALNYAGGVSRKLEQDMYGSSTKAKKKKKHKS